MSAASRERQRQRMLISKRGGFATFEEFRSWQRETLAKWTDFWGRPSQFGEDGEAMVYPEPISSAE